MLAKIRLNNILAKRNYSQQYSSLIQTEELKALFNKSILEFNAHDYSLISTNDSPDSENYRGKFLKRIGKENTEIIICSDVEVLNSNIVCLGGQGFDTLRHHSALLRSFEKLIGAKFLADQNARQISPISYQSSYNNRDRYNEFQKYSLNEKPVQSKYCSDSIMKLDYAYFSPDIEALCVNTIIPMVKRIFQQDKYASLILYSYSGGGREIMMIQNALTAILHSEYGMSFATIQSFFCSIRSLSLAFATSLPEDNRPRFTKHIYFTMEDSGVKIPLKFAAKYPDFPGIFENPYTKVHDIRTNTLSNSIYEQYYFYGMNQIKDKRHNTTGHELNYYINLAKDILDEDDQDIMKTYLNPYGYNLKNNFWSK